MTRQPIPASERGFVLISTIWLLLLGAAIVAAISLRVLHQAKSYSANRIDVQRTLALESAHETVIADILFNGPRSSFAQLPATGYYNIGGFRMKVDVTSESGKLDLNTADPALVDRVLRGLGVAAGPREAYLTAYNARRASRERFGSIADIEKEMQQAGIALTAVNDDSSALCAARYFTSHSGLQQPNRQHSAPQLNRALGEAVIGGGASFRAGEAVRIVISTDSGPALVTVVRITGRLDQTTAILDWQYGQDCAVG